MCGLSNSDITSDLRQGHQQSRTVKTYNFLKTVQQSHGYHGPQKRRPHRQQYWSSIVEC